MKKKFIAFQIDERASINLNTDSTYLIIREFIKRGYQVIIYDSRSLHYVDGELMVLGAIICINDDEFFALPERKIYNLTDMQLVFIRNEPPFDSNYLTTTYLLETLQGKTLVLNDPTAIRECPEKLFGLRYLKYTIPSIIANGVQDGIWPFFDKYHQIIIKPLYDYGGNGVKLVSSKQELIAAINNYPNNQYVILQKYLPQVKKGDKRILLLDGELLGCFTRVPQEGEIRANLVQGGKAQPCELTEREQKLIAILAPELKSRGLFLVGLDMLDGYMLECNTTCPTGLVTLNKLYNLKTEDQFVDKALAKLYSHC